MAKYPVHLGIAYLFLVGYLVRTLFVCLRLPASVGVLLSGFAFSYFLQDDLHDARFCLQELAFFVVLFAAGLDITLRDLQPYIFVITWLPWMLEVASIGLYSVTFLDFTHKESLVLGTVVATVGPGLVIPKMKEFGARFKRHPLPRLAFTCAPLEGSLALVFFGFLVGLAAPAEHPVHLGVLVAANALRLVATLVVGGALGAAAGWLIPRRVEVRFFGRSIFNGLNVEAFLMALAVALVAYALGQGEKGSELVPIGFAPGSLFQSELSVIVMSITFALVTDREVLGEVEGITGGVWVFGQLMLFSFLGSEITHYIFLDIVDIVPLMCVGVFSRCIGVFAAMFLTRGSRGCSRQPYRSTAKDATFCFLATLPRATLQAALGAVPIAESFFRGYPHRHFVEHFILKSARVYLCCMSVVGQILLNTCGPLLLRATIVRPPDEHCKGQHHQGVSDMTEPVAEEPSHATPGSEVDVLDAIMQLAEKHNVAFSTLRRLLERAGGEDEEDEDGVDSQEVRQLSEDVLLPRAGSKRTSWLRKARTRVGGDLVLSQFDTIGSLYSQEPATRSARRERNLDRRRAIGRAVSSPDM